MICVEVHPNNVLTVRDDVLSNAVADSIKHETIKFLFGEKWKGYSKTAVFTAGGVEPINILLDAENALCVSEDECYIPFEVLKGDSFTVSLFGVCGESIATTTKVEIQVYESGYLLGDAPKEPTQSEYSQIIDIMTDTREIANSVRVDANNGLFKGEKGDTGEKGDKGDKGDTGPQGPQGEKGEGVGRTFADSGEIFNDYAYNQATGIYSHAEGYQTLARGAYSHASGHRTVAGYDEQFVCGSYNKNKPETKFEVGGGYIDLDNTIYETNLFEVYNDGHAEVSKTGTTDKSVVTKKYVDDIIGNLEALLGGI